MSSIERFKAAAEGAKTNRDYVNTGSGSSSSSLKSLIESSYAELEATSDEVDRSTSDSSSSSSGTSFMEIASAAITGLTGLATAYATIKGTMGNKNGDGGATGGGAAAGGGDPLKALESATSTYSANPTKDNLKALATSITTASSARDVISAEVTAKETNIKNLESKLVDGKATFESCKEITNDLIGKINESQDFIETTTSTLDEKNKQLKNIEAGKTANGEAITTNESNQRSFTEQQENAQDTVDNTNTGINGTTAQQQQEDKKNNEYISKYHYARQETQKLENAVTKADEDISVATAKVNSAQGRVNGLKSQISAQKKQNLDSSNYEAQLKEAESGLKDAKKALDEAKDNKKTADKNLEENENTIKDLENKITVGGQTLAQLKAEIESLTQKKEAAEQQVQEACTALRGYVNEATILGEHADQFAINENSTQEQISVSNTALANALKGIESLTGAQFDSEKATATINNDIASIQAELGDEKDANSLRGKLAAYNTAISRAESVRDNGGVDLTTTASLTEGSELAKIARDLGYCGTIDGITAISNDGENFKITKNGKEILVDKYGKKIETPVQN